MTALLVLDASSSICSVSLIASHCWHLCEEQPGRNAQRLLPMMDDILQQAGIGKQELSGVAYGRGPGSFTGLRIAASITQGVALGLRIPVYGIPSLKALAHYVLSRHPIESGSYIIAVMNAHMGEVFWGIYQLVSGELKLLGCEQVGHVDMCLRQLNELDNAYTSNIWENSIWIGDGLLLDELYQELSQRNIDLRYQHVQPQSEYMCDMAIAAWQQKLFSTADHYQPVYLRDSVAWKKLDEQPALLKSHKG